MIMEKISLKSNLFVLFSVRLAQKLMDTTSFKRLDPFNHVWHGDSEDDRDATNDQKNDSSKHEINDERYHGRK